MNLMHRVWPMRLAESIGCAFQYKVHNKGKMWRFSLRIGRYY